MPSPQLCPPAHPDRGRGACVSITVLFLLWTLGSGIVLGVKSARPELAVAALPMQVIQPLHTLGVVCFLVSGIATLLGDAIRRVGGVALIPPLITTGGLLLFFTGGVYSVVTGRGSGLEYTSWPPELSVLPIALFAAMAWDVWKNLGPLTSRAPEGVWLLTIGLCLTPLGLIERAAWIDAADPTRALMTEWHALDTVFAGLNTSLYGLAVIRVSKRSKPKPLRAPVLYAIASFALLSTFGHHHYMSDQPLTLKYIAFAASMLGLVSFIRHMRAHRKPRTPNDTRAGERLLRSGAIWTIFAIGSGVLLAVPHINLLLHGTHAIVGHAMGAVIGVNVSVVLGLMLGGARDALDPVVRARTQRLTGAFNIILLLMVLDLFAAGAAKGWIRLDGTHHDYQPIVRNLLLPLPILGVALTFVIVRLCATLFTKPSARQRAYTRYLLSQHLWTQGQCHEHRIGTQIAAMPRYRT